MSVANHVPLIVSIPHSGEKIPEMTPWLKTLPEEILMCDVDRFVDRLYEPSLAKLKIPFAKTEWHRYAADMNRIPDDVDASSVQGHKTPAGPHMRGFHWSITTLKTPLMKAPMSFEDHQKLVQLIYEPFHESIRNLYQNQHDLGFKKVFHLDLHSMPSLGTSEHRDPGQLRADIVVSDCKGTSCDPRFKDLVLAAYATAGFKVAYNWPYFGGRVTEVYGDLTRGQHAIQVELNRGLYMNEQTKQIKVEESAQVQKKLEFALEYIKKNLEFLA